MLAGGLTSIVMFLDSGWKMTVPVTSVLLHENIPVVDIPLEQS